MSDDEAGPHEEIHDHLLSPITAGDVKKSMVVILKDIPCKVLDVAKAKTGKHGHAKATITGVCIINGKKVIVSEPAHATIYVAETTKREYQVIEVRKDEVDVLDDEGEQKSFKLVEGEEECEGLKAAYSPDSDEDFFVTVLTAPVVKDKAVVQETVVVSWKKAAAK